MKIEGSYTKTLLAKEIESKNFVVFVVKGGKKDYTFYGIYKLSNLYTVESGAGSVINGHTPLEFYLEVADYVL